MRSPIPFLLARTRGGSLLLFLTLAGRLGAVPPPRPHEVGLPFLRNFSPKEYGAGPANMAIVQDRRGLLYVANREGVLEYDGVSWRLIPTANRTGVYSLAVDGSGRVFVGAQGELGYLAPDATGRLGFVSLKDRLEPALRNFSEVLGTCATSQGVYFYTRNFLFRFANDGFTSWRAATAFHRSFAVDDRFFIRQGNVGLMEVKGGKLDLVPSGERFARDRVDVMLPFGSGQLLVGSRDLGLFLYDGKTLTAFPTEVDAFLKKNLLYSGVALPDGTFSLGTFQGGSVILDRDGKWRMTLNRSSGLPDETIDSQYVDAQSGLWLGLDNGLTRLEWPSALSAHGDKTGLKGKVYGVVRHRGTLFVGTSSGLFRSEPERKDRDFVAGDRPCFAPVEGLKGQNWKILSCGDSLLVGNYQGVYEVRDAKARLLRPSTTSSFDLVQSRLDPRRVFIGLSEGLASIYQNPGPGGGWADEGKVPGLSEGGYTLVETDDGRVWISTRVNGVARVDFPKGDRGTPRVQFFTAAQGLPSNNGVNVHRVHGEVVFSTSSGLYAFDEGTGRFHLHARFAALFPSGPRRIQGLCEDAGGRVWMDTLDTATKEHEVGCAITAGDGTLRWESLRRLSESSVNHIWSEDGVIWFGSADGLFRFDSTARKPLAPAGAAYLRQVRKQDGQALFAGYREDAAEPSLPYSAHALRFEFAAPDFDLLSANRYQVFLEGLDRDWSPWTAETIKEYTNLPEGRYHFRVRAKNVYGGVGPEDRYGFRLLPPWYRTWWAYLGFLGAGSWLLLLGHRAKTRLLTRRNLELQARIQEATAELSDREQEAQGQARNLAKAYDELQGLNGQLQEVNVQLAEANAQKNLFFGIVAHDLRNPLNGIVLEAQLLDGEEDLNEVWTSARKIQREGMEMSTLIGRFLEIAAIESGEVHAEPSAFSVVDVARHVADRHRAAAEAKGIELQVEAAIGAGRVYADIKFTKEVLDNLISNAIKFSPAGKRVRVQAEAVGGKVFLSVEDQGPGLTAEDQKKLFGRFARLSAQPTGGEKSTGLGLSIVKHMVEAMAGRIWVESEPGHGATFRLELPAEAAKLSEEQR